MSVTASIRDDDLANLVASGRTIADCASVLGVSTSTIYRRMGSPTFRALLSAARSSLWQPDAERLRASFRRSIERLEYLRDHSESESIQLKASEAIARFALELKKIAHTDDQLASMAAQLAGEDITGIPHETED